MDGKENAQKKFRLAVEAQPMPKYRFIVQSPSGKVRRGTITEKDEEAARESLQSAGFSVVSLEESSAIDLVVHTPAAGPSGRPRSAPQRAAIIEFEVTPWEKIQSFLNKFFLRKEVALLLTVAGLIWIVVSWLGRPEPPPPMELEYTEYRITISVEGSKFPDAHRVKIRLPDIPYSVTENLKTDEPSSSIELVFEAARDPEAIEVTLVEGTSTPVAQTSGTLQAAGQKGMFTFEATDFQAIKEAD